MPEQAFPIGRRLLLPGHFAEPVVLESVRPLGAGFECRVRLPREARALERAPMNGSWTDRFNSTRGKAMTAATKSSRSGPMINTPRRTEPGGLWPPAQMGGGSVVLPTPVLSGILNS